MTPNERARLVQEALCGAQAVKALELEGEVRPVPTGLLELTHRQCFQLARQGYALFWLMDQLGVKWAAHPDMRLSDRLKAERPDRLAYLARELERVGVTDLSDLALPPDPELEGGDDGQPGGR
jgi:hypothetical protein